MNPLDALPVWATAALLFVLLVATCEAGARINAGRGDDDNSEEGYLVSAALGLLALLLGFTFSLALDRYEQRRQLVVQEANAIGTLWLRVDLFDAAPRAATRRLLMAYTEARLAIADAGEDARRLALAEARSDALRDALWRAARPAAVAVTNGALANGTVAALTEVFDIGDDRRAALAARVPPRVIAVLSLYTVITAVILGYATGRGKIRHRTSTTALFALLAMTCGLILDLDRPRTGAIVVSQAPLFEVRATMRSSPG